MIWHSHRAEDVLQELNTDRHSGLSDEVARQRLEEYGENRPVQRPAPLLSDRYLRGTFIFLLAVCALVAAYSYYMFTIYDKPFQWLPIVITAVLGFLPFPFCWLTTSAARRAEERARQATAPTAQVVRDGTLITVSAYTLVPGDILPLNAGCRVPADCRLIEAHGLVCDERALTGDDTPAGKDADAIHENITPMPSRNNMIFAASHILEGSGLGVVIATGQQSELGRIAPTDTGDFGRLTRATRITRWSCVLLPIISIALFFAGVWLGLDVALCCLAAAALPLAVCPATLVVLTARTTHEGVCLAADNGAVISDPATMELLDEVDTVCVGNVAEEPRTDLTPCLAYVNQKAVCLDEENAAQARLPLRLAALSTRADSEDEADCAYERDLLAFCKRTDTDKHLLLLDMPQLGYRALSDHTISIHQADQKAVVIVCGQPEAILPHCTRSTQGAEAVLAVLRDRCRHTIAVAFRFISEAPAVIEPEELVCELTLAGLLGCGNVDQDGTTNARPLITEQIEELNALSAEGHVTLFVADSTQDLPSALVADVVCATESSNSLVREAAHVQLTTDTDAALAALLPAARRLGDILRRRAAYLLGGGAVILYITAALTLAGNGIHSAVILWSALLMHLLSFVTPTTYTGEHSEYHTKSVLLPAVLMTMCPLVAMALGYWLFGIGVAATMTQICGWFTLVMTTPCLLCPLPLSKTVIKALKVTLIVAAAALAVTCGLLYVPSIQTMLGLRSLPIAALLLTLPISLLPATAAELCKRFINK